MIACSLIDGCWASVGRFFKGAWDWITGQGPQPEKPVEAPPPVPMQPPVQPPVNPTVPSVTIPPNPYEDTEFVQSLCDAATNIGHGFGAAELLLVMTSETGGKLDPTLGRTSGALGLNQIILSELQKIRPGMTRLQYTSLSRADQMAIVEAYFIKYSVGLDPVAMASLTFIQRAAILYAINIGGSSFNASLSNYARQYKTIPDDENGALGDTIILADPTLVKANGSLDVDKDGLITMQDLETVLSRWSARPQYNDVVHVLGCF